MIANDGDAEGLFHGAFLQSGAVIPRGDVTLGQQDYDDLVRAAGCAGSEDTLECLRQVPFSALKEAVNMSPGFLSYRVCHNPLDSLSALIYEPYPVVGEPCMGPEGGWKFLQSPVPTAGLAGWRRQDPLRHR